MTDVNLLPSSVAAFTEALHGGRGSLDAWIEVNDEREVRAHVEAYARANVAHATARLQAEIEAMRKDAARYRWLRDREIPEWLDLWHQNPDRIDDAIDAAMREEGKQ